MLTGLFAEKRYTKGFEHGDHGDLEQEVQKARRAWQAAFEAFTYAPPDLVDAAILDLKGAEERYQVLLRKLKEIQSKPETDEEAVVSEMAEDEVCDQDSSDEPGEVGDEAGE